jgi:hypothetical protein
MKRRITRGAICFVALMALNGLAHAQSAKLIRLPSAEEVFDLGGEWDALIEIYGQAAAYGAYPNVVKITITGSFCPITGQMTSPITIIGIRLKDNPLQMPAPAGSEIIRGELESNEFQKLEMISDNGKAFPCKGQIGENGNKITIDAPNHGMITLTRK